MLHHLPFDIVCQTTARSFEKLGKFSLHPAPPRFEDGAADASQHASNQRDEANPGSQLGHHASVEFFALRHTGHMSLHDAILFASMLELCSHVSIDMAAH